MAKTKKDTAAPTGLSVTRKGEVLTLKWKQKGTDYKGGQELKYRIRTQVSTTKQRKNGKKTWGAWKAVSIGTGTTAKSIQIERDNYFPNGKKPYLLGVEFAVRGKRKEDSSHIYNWSAWTSEVYAIAEPKKPTLSVSLKETHSGIDAPWAISISEADKRIYTRTRLETVLSTKASYDDVSWKSAEVHTYTGVSGTFSKDEDTSVIGTGSHTRHVRVRGEGPYGASAWQAKKFVYSLPYQAKNVKASFTEDDETGATTVTVTWDRKIDAAHPVDRTIVEYAIIAPEADLECPEGASWNEGNISKDIVDTGTGTATSKAQFTIDDVVAKDQCLYVRVNAWHGYEDEDNITYGKIVLASVGYLKDPEINSVVDEGGDTATLTVTNKSEVEDSFLVIVCQKENDPETILPIGVTVGGTINVKIPNRAEGESVKFGVFAMVGEAVENDLGNGFKTYQITKKMESQSTMWMGGEVPQAPSGVNVSQTDIPGTIRVGWNWDWKLADSAVISWADHIDAWESTDEPEEYTVTQMYASAWNISGLETGKTWYVRVRLTKGLTDDVTYGPWSDIKKIDLSSAPSIPTLVVSESVVPADGQVTVSWAYSSTDGTRQVYAEITEATFTGSGIEYSDPPIAHTETAQHVDLIISDMGWQAGETHYLCVRVTSASGRKSDNWSDPVAVNVADPIECEITETSLAVISQEVNPRTFSGDIVTFDTELEEDMPKAEVAITPKQDLHGYDKPWAGGGGVNQWDEEWEVGAYNSANGEKVNSNDRIRSKNFIPILPSTTYYKNKGLQLYYYDADQVYISWANTGNMGTFTTPSNAYYMTFNALANTGTTYNNDIAINYPSTVTTYSPYENICPITGTEDVGVSVRGKNWLTSDYNEYIVGASYLVKMNILPENIVARMTFTDKDTSVDVSGCYLGFIQSDFNYTRAGSPTYFRWCLQNGVVNQNLTNVGDGNVRLSGIFIYPKTQETFDKIFSRYNVMVELGSTATDYEPYAGTDYTTTLVTNVWDEEWELGIIQWNTGASGTSTTQIRSKNSIRVLPNTTYYFSKPTQGNVAMAFYDADGDFIMGNADISGASAGGSFTTPPNAQSMKFCMGAGYGTTYNNDIAIYYPPMPDGKVYGGTVDVVSGRLVISYAMVDMGSLTWTYNNGGFLNTNITGVMNNYSRTSDNNILCSNYTEQSWYSIDAGTVKDKTIHVLQMSSPQAIAVRVYDTGYTDATTFKTAVTGQQIVYELATPQIYQLTPQQIQTLTGKNNVWSDSGNISIRIAESAYEVNALTELPLTVTAEGAGEGGTTTLIIERAADYHMDRPDETDFNGFEGETVYLGSHLGEGQFEVNPNDLIGYLDDEAQYRIVTTVEDSYGQTAEDSMTFEVHWNHQAIMPEGTVEIDDENMIAKITPVIPNELPAGWSLDEGDTFDIYRLSADRPELIVQNGAWGTTYVDPYPALGENGGHRIVFKTVNGDYITAENIPSWLDLGEDDGDILDLEDTKSIIDFGGTRILLSRNVDLSNEWSKDFQETRYLGGSVQGDWNVSVGRTASVNTTTLPIMDADVIDAMRKLAVYPGICHIRTFDGTSMECDIQVSENRSHDTYGQQVDFTLSITRVDPEGFEGMTLDQWEEGQEE